jgi:hypothetical protein
VGHEHRGEGSVGIGGDVKRSPKEGADVALDINKEADRRQFALGMADRMGNEGLAQRIDKLFDQKFEVGGLRDLLAVIEKEIYHEMQVGGLSYNAALLKVARSEPDLFLSAARMQIGGVGRDESLYFDFVNGMLVNPHVLRDGRWVFLDSPLDVRALPAGSSVAQEIALRVAQKMQKSLAASEGSPMSYGDALRLVASECPRLAREWQTDVRSGE